MFKILFQMIEEYEQNEMKRKGDQLASVMGLEGTKKYHLPDGFCNWILSYSSCLLSFADRSLKKADGKTSSFGSRRPIPR